MKIGGFFWKSLVKCSFDPLEPMYLGKWESMFHEKVIFHLDDAIIISLLIDDYFPQDIWINIPNCVFVILNLFQEFLLILGRLRRCGRFRIQFGMTDPSLKLIQFAALHYFQSLRNIDLDTLISPHISFFLYFFFRKAIIDEIGHRIIEVERIHRSRKEISECSISFHSSKDFTCFLLPFFFRILCIQDTVGFILESDTPEAVVTRLHNVGIIDVHRLSDLNG